MKHLQDPGKSSVYIGVGGMVNKPHRFGLTYLSPTKLYMVLP